MDDKLNIELICMIVNYDWGSRVIKSAKRCGVSGGTVTLGRGAAGSGLLDFLGLAEVRKEIVYMAAEREVAYMALEELNKEYQFHRPNHGIAFSTSICGILGTKHIVCRNNKEERGAENPMYHVITVIVDKGKAEDVITAATKAGFKGGTIMNARGSGIHETRKLFSMDIEPEKEIVIILSETDKTEEITSMIKDQLNMDEPGNGIIYVQNANKTYGIYK
ncbi:P-II family nitrogen regulator [Muricomes intestini]|uniref:P-II family nitrogen regulator n=1 Tax=Muricomes intestini TaxID=1796634 RepID=UPI002FE12FE1